MSDLYDSDVAAWSEQQAALLRRRAAGELVNEADIDWRNVAEEIEDLARSDKREINNRLIVICEHLLKWRYQPEGRGGSWRGSVIEARDKIADLIEESPSLRPWPGSRLVQAYGRGCRKAEAETGLTRLPAICEWSIEQVLDHDFWPDAPTTWSKNISTS
jgi:uncharacterized protein DUF29